MDKPNRKVEWMVWGGLALLIATLAAAFLLTRLGATLPVYGQVADFTLTNQHGRAVTLADLRGQVWIADIIFTRCPGPCLAMSRNMKQLEQALPRDSRVKLVSLTTDPDFDTPEVLKAYATDRVNADHNRWLFLTGTKSEISKLAVDSLKLTAIEKKPEERESPQDLFIHSTIFVIVDEQARLRGVFETTGEHIDAERVKQQILAAARRLEK